MESLPEPLALFLEALLEEAPTVQLVVDNFRGLREEDAKSYIPPPPFARISNTSLPELCRWGGSSSQLVTEGIVPGSADCLSTTPSEAPKVPTRRTSWDSDEDCQEYWGDDDNSDSRSNASSSSTSHSSLGTMVASLHKSILAELAEQENLNDDDDDNTRSPPKAPQRQSSLSFDRDTLPTNVRLPDQDQLECADIQKVAKRRYGVSYLACGSDPLSSMLSHTSPHTSIENPRLVLDKIHRDICIREEDEDVDDGPMFSSSQRHRSSKQDSSPSCARRRPSPQVIDKFACSGGMDDSSSKAPSCAKRRPSPQLDKALGEGDDNSVDSSPARAKRRPSPEEFETFGNLMAALTGTSITTAMEEAKQ